MLLVCDIFTGNPNTGCFLLVGIAGRDNRSSKGEITEVAWLRSSLLCSPPAGEEIKWAMADGLNGGLVGSRASPYYSHFQSSDGALLL